MQDLQQGLLSDYKIIVHSYENVEINDISKFLKKIDSITSTNEGSIIQLLDADYICGEKHIKQAISQSIKAFDENQNFAKDKGLEICVRLSAQKQINQALKILGIKKQGNVTAIYINTNEEQVLQTEELLGTRNDALLDEYDAQKICEAYNLHNDGNIVESINENIALLAIKN